MGRTLSEVSDLSARSVAFARGIGHASTGERLGQLMRETMVARPGPYAQLRAAVEQQVRSVASVGEEIGLFMLAADMATTADVAPNATVGDRQQLRRLWNDLRAK